MTLSLVGGIALQLGIDEPIVLTDAGTRIHDRPTEVGVDLEAGEDLDAVQQAADDREMLRRARGVDEGVRPGQLEVAAGRCLVE